MDHSVGVIIPPNTLAVQTRVCHLPVCASVSSYVQQNNNNTSDSFLVLFRPPCQLVRSTISSGERMEGRKWKEPPSWPLVPAAAAACPLWLSSSPVRTSVDPAFRECQAPGLHTAIVLPPNGDSDFLLLLISRLPPARYWLLITCNKSGANAQSDF